MGGTTIEGKKPKMGDVELDTLAQKKDHSTFIGTTNEEKGGVCFGRISTILLVSNKGTFSIKDFESGVTTRIIDGDFDLNGRLSNIHILSHGDTKLRSDYGITHPSSPVTKTDGEMTVHWVIAPASYGGTLNLDVSDKNDKLVQTVDGYFNSDRTFTDLKIWLRGDAELKFPEILEGNLRGALKKLREDIQGVLENKQVQVEVERLKALPALDANRLEALRGQLIH